MEVIELQNQMYVKSEEKILIAKNELDDLS